MEIIKQALNGVFVLKPAVFGDARGYFFESFNLNKFKEITGCEPTFVQDNESKSTANVLRGLHFQNPPFAQGKLVRVIQGSVLDVAVDIRKGSPTYGRHITQILSAENKFCMWIPEGFAHGFASLEDDTIFSYKCTNYYAPRSEMSIDWNDQELGIDWNIKSPLLSNKDLNGLKFSSFVSEFEYRG